MLDIINMGLGHLNAFAAHDTGAGISFKKYNITFCAIATNQSLLTCSQSMKHWK
jgi:hypothetical protein